MHQEESSQYSEPHTSFSRSWISVHNYSDDKVNVNLIVNPSSAMTTQSLEVDGNINIEIKKTIPNNINIDLKGLYTLEIIPENYMKENGSTQKINGTFSTMRSYFKESDGKSDQIHITQSEFQSEGETEISLSTMTHEYFLECSQQLFQLGNLGKALKSLSLSQDASENIFSYPFSFTIPGSLPPSLEEFVFSGVKIKIMYMLSVTNPQFSHTWTIPILTSNWLHSPCKQKRNESEQNSIIAYPSSKRSGAQQNMSQTLTNHYVFKLYKYCFFSIGQFTIQITARVPTPQIIQLYIHLYSADTEQSEEKIMKIVGDVRIRLLAHLMKLRKRIVYDKILKLHRADIGGLYSQVIIKLDGYPRAYRNQLFVMRYYLQTEVLPASGLRVKEVKNSVKDILV